MFIICISSRRRQGNTRGNARKGTYGHPGNRNLVPGDLKGRSKTNLKNEQQVSTEFVWCFRCQMHITGFFCRNIFVPFHRISTFFDIRENRNYWPIDLHIIIILGLSTIEKNGERRSVVNASRSIKGTYCILRHEYSWTDLI
jgi:hypothetical protein